MFWGHVPATGMFWVLFGTFGGESLHSVDMVECTDRSSGNQVKTLYGFCGAIKTFLSCFFLFIFWLVPFTGVTDLYFAEYCCFI